MNQEIDQGEGHVDLGMVWDFVHLLQKFLDRAMRFGDAVLTAVQHS